MARPSASRQEPSARPEPGRWLGILAVAAILLAAPAVAQEAETVETSDAGLPPSGLPPLSELPLAEPPAPDAAPEAAPDARETPTRLSEGTRIHVAAFRVEGSSVFGPEELAAVTAPYAGRGITQAELIEARDAVTWHYIDRGYLTSGATIPDQSLGEDGVVVIRVVEGALAEVRVTGTRSFRARYFESRLKRAGRAPVNVYEIEALLRRLQGGRFVETVNASLKPGAVRGESILEVEVKEATRFVASVTASNAYSPALGGEGGEFYGGVANLAGVGDFLALDVNVAAGLQDYRVDYDVPILPWDTSLGGYYRWSESEIVAEPFDTEEVIGEVESWGVRLEQPAIRNDAHEVWLEAAFDHRKSVSVIEGTTFPFPYDGVVTVFRAAGTWTWRAARDGVAVYNRLSFGVGGLGGTHDPDPRIADSRFFAWLGQAQWAHQFFDGFWSSRLVTRFNIQLASQPLLSVEKFGVGGIYSVRGYPQNLYVRDNGFAGSVEFWLPLWRDRFGNAMVQVAPFVDFGRAWDVNPVDLVDPRQDQNGINGQRPENLASMGLALRVTPSDWLTGELVYGGKLVDVDLQGDDVQNHGVHFMVRVSGF